MTQEQLLRELSEFTVIMEKKTTQISKLIGKNPQANKWLFGSDVKRMLNISESTLRRMRIRNDIPFTKIGRTHYYPSIFFDKVLLEKTKKEYSKLFDQE